MLRGDLVQVRPGIGGDGRLGVLMNDAGMPFTHCMVLFPTGIEEINRYWLEVIGSRVTGDEPDVIGQAGEK